MSQDLRQDARELWRVLGDGEWRKQGEIPIAGPRVRAICNQFAPWFVSNTSQGYRRTDLADEEEIRHSINDLRSRANKMLERAAKLETYLFNTRQDTII